MLMRFLSGGSLNIERREIRVAHLQHAFRLLHISDIHLKKGDEKFYDEFKSVLEKVEGLDFITVGGDIINDDVGIDMVPEFFSLLPDVPKIAVLGNHDFGMMPFLKGIIRFVFQINMNGYQLLDTKRLRVNLKKSHVHLLEQDGIKMDFNGRKVFFYGLKHPSYPDEHEVPGISDQKKEEKGVFKVLLVHRPDVSERHVRGFHLVMGGHTHGGQVRMPVVNRPWSSNSRVIPRQASGHYRIDSTHWIVNNGFSSGEVRFRLGAPRQISVIDVVPGDQGEVEVLKCR